MSSKPKLQPPEEKPNHSESSERWLCDQTIKEADRIDNIVRTVITDYMYKKGYSVVRIVREVKEFEGYCWVQWDGEPMQPGGLLVTLINTPARTPKFQIAVGEHPATGRLENLDLQEVLSVLRRETGLKGRFGWIHK